MNRSITTGSIMENSIDSYMGDNSTVESGNLGDAKDLDDPTFRRSFVNMHFQTDDSKLVVKQFSEYTDPSRRKLKEAEYRADQVYPEWMRTNELWVQSVTAAHNEISDILEKPKKKRSEKEWKQLVSWMMQIWHTARELGPKRCFAMTKAFHFFHYEPGTDIITEGDRGLTFYIIVEGTVDIIKDGVGKVAEIGRGKSFGEIALTGKEGSDLRTATVRAQTKVQTLSLHKSDYDLFVKDIQQIERRENFQVFRRCPLFYGWPRAKIEKMANTGTRKDFPAGHIIFKQGDEPDYVYVVIEGTVEIVKEVKITSRNRWPEAMNKWGGKARMTVKEIIVDRSRKDNFFGELSILKGTGRHATARAAEPVQLLRLGALEFLHLLQNEDSTTGTEMLPGAQMNYKSDADLLRLFRHVGGGPSSTIETYSEKMTNAGLDEREARERKAHREEVAGKPSSPKPASHGGGAGRLPTISHTGGAANDSTAGGSLFHEHDASSAVGSIATAGSHESFLDKMKAELYEDGTFGQLDDDVKHQKITAESLNQMDAITEILEHQIEDKALHKEDLRKRASIASMSSPHGRRLSSKMVSDLRSMLHKQHDHQQTKPHGTLDGPPPVGPSAEQLQHKLNAHANRNSRKTLHQGIEEHNSEVRNPEHNADRLWVIPKSKSRVKAQRAKSLSRFEQHLHDTKEHKKKTKLRRQTSVQKLGSHGPAPTSGVNLRLSIDEHHLEHHRSTASMDEDECEGDRRARSDEMVEESESERMLHAMEEERMMAARKEDQDNVRRMAEEKAAAEAAQYAALNESERAIYDAEKEAAEVVAHLHRNQVTSVDADNNADANWIHDADDNLEEEEIKNLSAEQLADMYENFQYAHSRHEQMLENLDFDPAHIGDGDMYDDAEIKMRRHETLMSMAGALDGGDTDTDTIDGSLPPKPQDDGLPDTDDNPHVWRQHRQKQKAKPKPNMTLITKARLTYKDILGVDE